MCIRDRYGREPERWHETQTQEGGERIEDHTLIYLRNKLVPLVMTGSEPAWRVALPFWRGIARYAESCPSRVSGSLLVDYLGEILLHTHKKLLSNFAEFPTLSPNLRTTEPSVVNTGVQILSIWSSAVGSSRSVGLKELFLGLFVEREGLRAWVEQMTLGVLRQHGITEQHRVVLRHYATAMKAFGEVHEPGWSSQHGGLFKRVFGFLATPMGDGGLYSWLENTGWSQDSQCIILVREVVTSLYRSKQCLEVLCWQAEAAVELHYVRFLVAYQECRLEECCVHLEVLVALANGKNEQVAQKFEQLCCLQVLLNLMETDSSEGIDLTAAPHKTTATTSHSSAMASNQAAEASALAALVFDTIGDEGLVPASLDPPAELGLGLGLSPRESCHSSA
eukprot:TRINITY_DN51013_c0_g1_i1.p1 TRINITY_DN51013_c0_g1~~TRINITY_DN51013_c0_g1_i1.p1  ORF type:complete len:393 (-),score=98.50 TRINITY_DN51013_c0_g1_i1:159-1337(-)